MLFRKIGIAFSLTLMGVATVGSVGAQAATVSNKAGTVLVSRGDGFVAVTAGVEAGPGTQVMVRPGGMATIAYGGGCMVRIGPGLWPVQAKPPCAEGIAVVDFTGRMNQGAPPEEPLEEGPPAISPTTGLVIGGALVAGGVGLALILSQNDNDKPASP
jgi:hypothetical protein